MKDYPWNGEINWRRIYGVEDMFSCEIPYKQIEIGDNYNMFGKWFVENCIGQWAYPDNRTIKFTHEEDKVKFICLSPFG